ncbi:hypothetical protein [Kribbella soli]|uniref:Uncharacterized protein n=1 Tax=Kribbella soli TaxID=1124743 RepID=A0A4R0HI07_9ACTN|nr:hypothetical protein [Kribbella soli]TCC10945.1 hypothetical protein E0H45_06520 [Kribbella soli]
MSWQLWVLIALVAAVLVVLAALRMRHARKVFDDITELDRPTAAPPAESASVGDDLSRARARHLQAEADSRHRRHG